MREGRTPSRCGFVPAPPRHHCALSNHAVCRLTPATLTLTSTLCPRTPPYSCQRFLRTTSLKTSRPWPLTGWWVQRGGLLHFRVRSSAPFSGQSTPCAVCRVPCAVCRVPCAVCRVPCAVCRVPCAVCRVPCAVCRVSCAVCRVPCAVCRVRCAVCPTTQPGDLSFLSPLHLCADW